MTSQFLLVCYRNCRVTITHHASLLVWLSKLALELLKLFANSQKDHICTPWKLSEHQCPDFTAKQTSWSSFQEVCEHWGAVQTQISSCPGLRPQAVSSGLSADFHKVFADFSDIMTHKLVHDRCGFCQIESDVMIQTHVTMQGTIYLFIFFQLYCMIS